LNPTDAAKAESEQRARTRQAMRLALRERRLQLPPRERIEAASEVAGLLRPVLSGIAGRIAGYWAVRGELPLHAVQSSLEAPQSWCLPLLHDDGRLRFAEWRAGQALAPNRFGVPEPVDSYHLEASALAVVLVPLLAFGSEGQRLGQGGGWYDRTFAPNIAAVPLLIGVGYAWQHSEDVHAETWDVPLDAVVTERAFHRFSKRMTDMSNG